MLLELVILITGHMDLSKEATGDILVKNVVVTSPFQRQIGLQSLLDSWVEPHKQNGDTSLFFFFTFEIIIMMGWAEVILSL